VKKIVNDFKIENKKYGLKFQNEFTKYKKYTKEQVEQLREIISRFEKHENYLQEKSKVRNDFESTLYKLKDDFENPGLKTFSTEAELNKLKDSVKEELEWLEENAWTAEKIDFERHYKSVLKVYSPIVNRSQEYKER
jgi:molecular chaperone DnaK (HSP70)